MQDAEAAYLFIALSGLFAFVVPVAVFMWRSERLQREREEEGERTRERSRRNITNPS